MWRQKGRGRGGRKRTINVCAYSLQSALVSACLRAHMTVMARGGRVGMVWRDRLCSCHLVTYVTTYYSHHSLQLLSKLASYIYIYIFFSIFNTKHPTGNLPLTKRNLDESSFFFLNVCRFSYSDPGTLWFTSLPIVSH